MDEPQYSAWHGTVGTSGTGGLYGSERELEGVFEWAPEGRLMLTNL